MQQDARLCRAERARRHEAGHVIVRIAIDQPFVHPARTHDRDAAPRRFSQRVPYAARGVAVPHARQHDALRAARHQPLHRRGAHPGIGVQYRHVGEGCGEGEARVLSIAPGRTEPLERTGRDHRDPVARVTAEGIGADGARLARIARGDHVVAHHQQHATSARLRIARHAHRIGEIAQAVAAHGIGGPHRAHHHQRLGGRQGLVEQEGGFLRRIGAVGDDHAVHRRIGDRGGDVRMQPRPDLRPDVLGADVGDLLSGQLRRQPQGGDLL